MAIHRLRLRWAIASTTVSGSFVSPATTVFSEYHGDKLSPRSQADCSSASKLPKPFQGYWGEVQNLHHARRHRLLVNRYTCSKPTSMCHFRSRPNAQSITTTPTMSKVGHSWRLDKEWISPQPTRMETMIGLVEHTTQAMTETGLNTVSSRIRRSQAPYSLCSNDPGI